MGKIKHLKEEEIEKWVILLVGNNGRVDIMA